jgi:hypothetical protein
MPTEHFELASEWRVRAPARRVYLVLADLGSLGEFWPSVRVKQAHAAAGIVGSSARLAIRGLLPIALEVEVTIVAAEPEQSLDVVARGDLEGRGRWTLRERDGETSACFSWQVDLTHARLARVARRLRPLLVLSHRWAMWRGERGLRRILDARAPEPGQYAI